CGFGFGFLVGRLRLLHRRRADRRFPALWTFLGFTDNDVIAFRARDRAFDQQKVFRFAHLDDFQVLRRALHLAHVTGHAQSALHRTGKQALADGAAAAMPAFGTVRGVTTLETMAFDNAFETAALHDADGIDEIAGSEQRRADDVAGFDFLREIAEFLDAFDRGAVLLLDVAEERFGDARFFLVVETELDGVVTVFTGLGFDLQHAIGAREHDRDGLHIALGVVNARVSEFFS